MWTGQWKRGWQWYVLYILYCYDVAPDDNMFVCLLRSHSPMYVPWERSVRAARAGLFVHAAWMGRDVAARRATHSGYRVLRRMHTFGLRVCTKPCLHKHLYEPEVFTQRAFLHGLTRTSGSAHSSMSGTKKNKYSLVTMSHKTETQTLVDRTKL